MNLDPPQPAFIHSMLDDFGLTPAQFRVYCHLARRAGSGEAYASVDGMAKVCRLDAKTVRKCLKDLEQFSLVGREYRNGQTSIYRLLPMLQWLNPSQMAPPGGINAPPKPHHRRTAKRHQGGTPKPHLSHPSQTAPDKGNPIEGNPQKEILFKEIPPGIVFPDSLSSVPFREKFEEWMSYRRQRTRGNAAFWVGLFQRQLKMLAKHGEADGIEMIDTAMNCGWTGLFPSKKSALSKTSATPNYQQF